MDPIQAENLYERLMEINQETFEAGEYNATYHALMSALYLANQVGAEAPLMEIRKRALEQQAWIDQNSPEYEHSTPSTAKRGILETVFVRLSKQAGIYLRMRNLNNEKRKPLI